MTARRIADIGHLSDNLDIESITETHLVVVDKDDGSETIVPKEGVEDFEGLRVWFSPPKGTKKPGTKL